MERRFSGLWRHPDFMKLWIGQTISDFGSRITREGLPLIAILVLSATPAQMGFLTAVASLPVLLLGLFAGVWVDRLRRRPIMIAADIARAVILLSIPLAALAGRLTMEHLYIVAALTGILTLFFDVAYRAILPGLVAREHLLEGNSKLTTTEALAEIGGPAVTGLLVQWIGAPLAIVFDALSFLGSAVGITLIRKPESPAPRHPGGQKMLRDIADGLRVINGDAVLRTLVIGLGVRSFFGSFFGTLYGLYAIRELGLTPAILGFLVGAGGVGALIGALLAQRFPRRYGLGRTLAGALLCGGLINLMIPLANGPVLLAAGSLLVAQIIGDAAMVVYMINEISLRQMIVPERFLGRANATVGFLAEGVAPIGALVAGLLAGIIGARLTLLVAVCGILAVAVWILFSPVRRLQSHHTLEPTAAPEAVLPSDVQAV